MPTTLIVKEPSLTYAAAPNIGVRPHEAAFNSGHMSPHSIARLRLRESP